MNKKFALGILSILTILTTLVLSHSASAASTTLVISQAYGGGGGTTGTYTNDYVEIKNISNTQQSLNGLSLMYGSATGQFGSSATNIFALPNVTLNPGQYFLVQLSTAGTGGTALPVTPDASTTNLSMSGTNGKVALVTAAFAGNSCGATATPCTLPNAAIVDLVSWGTANNAEGGASTNGGASLTATQGNVRKNGGCQDTDNNNNDFDIVTAPVPRNTSTTTPCGSAVVNTQHVSDYDGDGKTDFALVRNIDGGPNGQARWFINLNGSTTTLESDWGLAGDFFVPEDYDGDNKSDLAVWRDTGSGGAFFILQSNGNTVRAVGFGQSGDDPTIVGDYDGDGKADLALYREGATENAQSTWFFIGSLNNPNGNLTYVPWGINGDFPAPGDYDGDGKNDFVVSRNDGGNQARFWRFMTTAGFDTVYFAYQTDSIVPGDYDGDGKTDLAVARPVNGNWNWYYRASSTGVVHGPGIFGLSSSDFIVPGDYDGDGKTDLAVWRATSSTAFWVFASATNSAFSVPNGLPGDFPPANSFVY